MAVIIEFMLICCPSNARKVPMNYILLAVFTLLESFAFSFICSGYDASSCIAAAAMTAAVTVALTLYAACTKKDFTVCG